MSGALLAYGASMGGARVSFATSNVADFASSPSESSVTVTFSNNGSYSASGNVSNFSGNWINPTSAAGNAYEIRMTVNSGTTPSDSTTGSWLGLGTSRSWSLTQSGTGETTANVTVEIRRASTGTVLSDGGGVFDMTATVSA